MPSWLGAVQWLLAVALFSEASGTHNGSGPPIDLPLHDHQTHLHSDTDTFTEELALRKWHDSTTVTLQFNLTHSFSDEFQYSSLFPRVISDLASEFQLREFEVSFGHGDWLSDEWGAPPTPYIAPSGAFLSAMPSRPVTHEWWPAFATAVGTQFCSALGVIPPSRSQTAGHVSGFLPAENVCAEHLERLLMLLPCQTRGGLAALAARMRSRLLRLPFVSATSAFAARCSEHPQHRCTWSWTVVVTGVVVPLRSGAGDGNAAKPLHESVFAAPTMPQRCPLITRPLVLSLHADAQGRSNGQRSDGSAIRGLNSPVVFLSAEDAWAALQQSDRTVWARVSTTPMTESSTSVVDEPSPDDDGSNSDLPTVPATLDVVRSVRTRAGLSGTLVATVRNMSPSSVASVCRTTFPPWVVPLLHTLRVNDETVFLSPRLRTLFAAMLADDDSLNGFELFVDVPPFSSIEISVDYRLRSMRVWDFGPNPSRGVDIPPLVVEVLDPSIPGRAARRTVTRSLLVATPTPDFSMPYNALALAGSILALFLCSTLKTALAVPSPQRPWSLAFWR